MRERLLTRHFLQRFLENDLISPAADRRQVLSIVAAALISSGVFLTFAFTLKYMTFQSPGRTAVAALDDRSFFIAWSMIVMALVAVAAWNGLAIDSCDASILGPLPIPYRTVVRAKLKAVMIFAVGFCIALNLAPSILYPLLMIGKLPTGLIGLAELMIAHAAVTTSAGAFGFLAVLGTRELSHMLLGPARFTRVSAVLQGLLVVLLATPLLLLPGWFSNVARLWLTSARPSPYAIPPLWFLGLHETFAGKLIDGLPRGPLPGRLLEFETEATLLYRSHEPLFPSLGGMAAAAFGVALVIAIGAYAWNSRRLPPPIARRVSERRRLGAASAWLARQLLVRNPEAQAGFFFTLQSLWRSAPHRLSMATCVAFALATVAMIVHGTAIHAFGDPVAPMPVALFGVQVAVICVLLVGFRHAVRVPAELRANWMIQLAWSGDERRYVSGVKRAALVGIGLPAIAVMCPVYLFALGPQLALLHFVSGALLMVLLLDLLLLSFRKLPFVCSYVPEPSVKEVAAIWVFGFIMTVYVIAWFERLAFSSAPDALTHIGVLAALVAAAKGLDVRMRRQRLLIDFDELPAPATQRLTLTE